MPPKALAYRAGRWPISAARPIACSPPKKSATGFPPANSTASRPGPMKRRTSANGGGSTTGRPKCRRGWSKNSSASAARARGLARGARTLRIRRVQTASAKGAGTESPDGRLLGLPGIALRRVVEEYEPGVRAGQLRALFAELRPAIVAILGPARERSAAVPEDLLNGNYPIAAQQAFNRQVAGAMGFDFEAGRINTTTHPFCSGVGPATAASQPATTSRISPGRFTESCTKRAMDCMSRGCRRSITARRWERAPRLASMSRSRGCGKITWAAARRFGRLASRRLRAFPGTEKVFAGANHRGGEPCLTLVHPHGGGPGDV